MKTDWDRRYVELAVIVGTWSKDPSTKVGAVLVGRNRKHIALGYNGFPQGIADTEERLNDRPHKLRLVQHAERNVLDQATFNTDRATLIVTRFPCSECAKSIISKGIKRVVYVADQAYGDRWLDEVRWAKEMLNEAGVQLTEVVL